MRKDKDLENIKNGYGLKYSNTSWHGTAEPEVQGKAVNNIDGIIMLLDLSAQLNANVTIQKEDIPILLEALEPVIKKRTEYWQQLQARFKPFNIK